MPQRNPHRSPPRRRRRLCGSGARLRNARDGPAGAQDPCRDRRQRRLDPPAGRCASRPLWARFLADAIAVWRDSRVALVAGLWLQVAGLVCARSPTHCRARDRGRRLRPGARHRRRREQHGRVRSWSATAAPPALGALYATYYDRGDCRDRHHGSGAGHDDTGELDGARRGGRRPRRGVRRDPRAVAGARRAPRPRRRRRAARLPHRAIWLVGAIVFAAFAVDSASRRGAASYLADGLAGHAGRHTRGVRRVTSWSCSSHASPRTPPHVVSDAPARRSSRPLTGIVGLARCRDPCPRFPRRSRDSP